MKKLNLILLAIIVNFTILKLHAQTASIVWTNVITSTSSTTLRDAVKDDFNRTYMLRGSQTIGFGTSTIYKITSTGTILTYVTANMDGRSLVVDNTSGDVYVLGSIFNVAYNKLIFCVAKYNSTLTFQWSKTLDFNYGISNANAQALKGVFANGNLYVAGYVNSGNATFGEDWAVAKISQSGVWYLGFKRIQIAGTGRPTDCGFMSDNNGVPGFYVCGSNIHPVTGASYSVLTKFDIALTEQWMQVASIGGSNVNEWVDMELFNYGIYLCGHSKTGPSNVSKAAWVVYTTAGLISNSFIYDISSANTSSGLKIQIDLNLNVYLGLQKSIPVGTNFREEAHVLKYISTGPIWDQSIGNWGPIPSCTPPHSYFKDMSLNSTGDFIYLAGDGFDCTGSYSNQFPYVCKLATSIGNVIWFDSSPVLPDGSPEMALKVFAVNSNDCINTGLRVSVGTLDNVYARRYTTTIPRLTSGETNEAENVNSLSAKINVFPNPAFNNIHISSESEINKISIYDLAGSLITEIDKNMIFETDLDVSFLKPGVYVLMAATRESQTTLKLVKQ